MFDLITNPIANIFFEKVSAYPGSSEFVLTNQNLITSFILLLIAGLAIATAYLAFVDEKEKFKTPSIFFSIIASIGFLSVFNSNIVKPENYKNVLSQKCFDNGKVEAAFNINPHFNLKTKKEVFLAQKYKGVNANVYIAIGKAYTQGLEDLAKDELMAKTYKVKYFGLLEHKARKGDMGSIKLLMEKLSPTGLQICLGRVKKTCDNAELAYQLAESINAEFEIKKALGEVDIEKTKLDIQKIEVLRYWASFSKNSCIPIFNKHN